MVVVSIISAIVLLVPFSQPSTMETEGDAISISRLQASLSEEELTRVTPLVVDAVVVSRQAIAVRDDPFLPKDWKTDPKARSLVESGYRHVRWVIRIERLGQGIKPQYHLCLAWSRGRGCGY